MAEPKRFELPTMAGFDIPKNERDVAQLIVFKDHLIDTISKNSNIDELTSLPNRRLILQQMEAIHRAGPMSVAFVDVDCFKSINDTYGHQIGDLALQHVARVLQSSFERKRKGDVLGRWGGEEFIAVFPGVANGLTASRLADDLRKKLESNPFKHGDIGFNITASMGIAIATHQKQIVTEVVDFADQALYYAKENGRNRVTAYDDHAFHHYSEGSFIILPSAPQPSETKFGPEPMPKL